MKKIYTFILLAISMLSLSAQTEKETVYIDFHQHIALLDNTIDKDGTVGIFVIDNDYDLTEDGYVCDGHIMALYYYSDELYTKLTPETKLIPEGAWLIDAETVENVDLSNLNGEVKEVDGRTVFDFTCDGSNGKQYVIHVEAYLPEVKEEIDMTFTDVDFMDLDSRFIMSGMYDDNYFLILECYLNGDSYDGIYNYTNHPETINSILGRDKPRARLMMLELEYTVTTREDGYYDIRGQFLLETGTLIHFYMTNAPEEEAGISSTAVSDSIEQIYDLTGKKLSGMQKGVNIIRMKDGNVRKVTMKF